MLTGQALGKAIDEAIRLKGVSKAAVARHFGVKGPSIYDWINHGRIGKQHLEAMFDYFADVVGREHWGLKDQSAMSQPMGLDLATLGAALTSMDRVIRSHGLRMEGYLGKFAPVLGFAYAAALEEFPDGPPSPDTRSGKAALRSFDRKVGEWLEGGLANGSIGPLEAVAETGEAGVGRRQAEGKKAARSR